MSSSFKTHNRKLHPGHVIIGENGQVVDTIATISASYVLIVGADVLTYAALQAIVTVPVGVDLAPLESAKPRYTGQYVLTTEDGGFYYIDRTTVDVAARTFVISRVEGSQSNPASIDLSAGWKIAEAEIVNRLATTAAAKVDSIEFRDLNFQVELDGDPVTVRGLNGNYLEPNTDGSLNIAGQDPMAKYSLHELDEAGSTTYIGYMTLNGTWILKLLVETGNDLTVTYANVSNNATKATFTLAWADRAVLNYDLIENLTGV